VAFLSKALGKQFAVTSGTCAVGTFEDDKGHRRRVKSKTPRGKWVIGDIA
jgi:hypothetical protein